MQEQVHKEGPPRDLNLEGLIEQLNDAYGYAKAEYVQLLFMKNYDAAVSKLNELELIEMHINKVEEL